VVERGRVACSAGLLLGTGWPKDAVEKGAELSTWIKSAWYVTVSVIEDGSGDLTSGYVGATAADKLLVLARLD
jgi:hypothetical protein